MTGALEAVSLDTVAAAVVGASEIVERNDGIQPLRLPRWTRVQQADRWIEFWAAHTVGIRLVLRTAATRLRLDATVTRMVPVDGTEPAFPACVVAEAGGEEVARVPVERGPLILTMADKSWRDVEGPATQFELELGGEGSVRDVVIWLPHNGATVIHGLEADATVTAAGPRPGPRWLHHGSSISHSLEAHTPRQTWPQLAATALGIELDNYAIAGNAQLDPFVARTLAARPADVITLKLGVNTINADSMKHRAFVPALHGFLDLVREGHPGTPIVVLSPIVSPAIEQDPGPTRKVGAGYVGSPRPIPPGDGTLTLGIVRGLIQEAVQQRSAMDDRLWCSDGLDLLGPDDAGLLWDDLHPDQRGYDLMAQRFVRQARDPGTALGRAFAGVLA